MTNITHLPRHLAELVEANTDAEYEAIFAGLLQDIALSIPEADYVDGIEGDALLKQFQDCGWDRIPDEPSARADRAEILARLNEDD